MFVGKKIPHIMKIFILSYWKRIHNWCDSVNHPCIQLEMFWCFHTTHSRENEEIKYISILFVLQTIPVFLLMLRIGYNDSFHLVCLFRCFFFYSNPDPSFQFDNRVVVDKAELEEKKNSKHFQCSVMSFSLLFNLLALVYIFLLFDLSSIFFSKMLFVQKIFLIFSRFFLSGAHPVCTNVDEAFTSV